MSESRCLQIESHIFGQTEHQVHVLHRLSRRAFHKVVDNGCDKQFAAVFHQAEYAFVGVYGHFKMYLFFIGNECKRCRTVEIAVQFAGIVFRAVEIRVCSGEYAARVVASYGQKIQLMVESVVEFGQRFPYFAQMLVCERLVKREVAFPP